MTGKMDLTMEEVLQELSSNSENTKEIYLQTLQETLSEEEKSLLLKDERFRLGYTWL